MRTRGAKAKRDKSSILADVKNLLVILHPAIQQMPKIERVEGAPQEMKAACYNIIRHFTIASENPEVRIEHIRAMFGEFGALLAAFDLCIQYGLLTGSAQLKIAMQLERIEELRDALGPEWWEMFDWDDGRLCATYKPEFSVNARLIRKYHLKVKTNDKTRNPRAKEHRPKGYVRSGGTPRLHRLHRGQDC